MHLNLVDRRDRFEPSSYSSMMPQQLIAKVTNRVLGAYCTSPPADDNLSQPR